MNINDVLIKIIDYLYNLINSGKMAVGIGVMAIVFSSFFLLLIKSETTKVSLVSGAQQLEVNKRVLARIDALESKLKDLSSKLSSASAKELQELGVTSLNENMQRISNELQTLSGIIVSSPEKALSIPFMRREIETIQQKQAALEKSTKEQVDRIYDFSKWFIALMITLALGLISSGLIKKEKEKHITNP